MPSGKKLLEKDPCRFRTLVDFHLIPIQTRCTAYRFNDKSNFSKWRADTKGIAYTDLRREQGLDRHDQKRVRAKVASMQRTYRMWKDRIGGTGFGLKGKHLTGKTCESVPPMPRPIAFYSRISTVEGYVKVRVPWFELWDTVLPAGPT